MANTSTTSVSSDNNQMVLGIAGLTAEGMAKQVAALLAAELSLYGVLALQNNNLLSESQAQADASKAGFDAQSKSDENSAILQGTGAGVQVAGVAAGAIKAYKVNSELSAHQDTLKARDEEDDRLKGTSTCEFKSSSEAAGEKPLIGPKPMNEVERTAAQTKNDQLRKTTNESIKSNHERQAVLTQTCQRGADSASAALTAGDKGSQSIYDAKQGVAKRNEVLDQTAVTLNGSTTQGLNTQQQAYASDIAATIAAEGAQGLAGQASMHKA